MGYLIVNDRLTQRWLRAKKINSNLGLTVRFDVLRHSLGEAIMVIYFVVGVIALAQPIRSVNINPRSLATSVAFVVTEWLIVAASLVDAITTYRLLRYNGVRPKVKLPAVDLKEE